MRVALVVAMLTVGSSAFADDAGYRNQLIVVDGISAGTVGGAAALGTWVYSPDDFHLPLMIGGFGFTGYVLGGPIVHLTHGRIGRGAASFGLRVLMPAIVSATLTTAAGLEEDDRGYGGYFAGGMALGAGIAIALDWWLLVPSGPSRTERRATPIVAPTTRGGVLGVAGVW
jgi:hypothetical protein